MGFISKIGDTTLLPAEKLYRLFVPRDGLFCGDSHRASCKDGLIWRKKFIYNDFGNHDFRNGHVIFAFGMDAGEIIAQTLKQFHPGEIQYENWRKNSYVYLSDKCFFNSHFILLDFFTVIARLCAAKLRFLPKESISEELSAFYWLSSNYYSPMMRFAVNNFDRFVEEITKEEYSDYIRAPKGIKDLSKALFKRDALHKIDVKGYIFEEIIECPETLRSLIYGEN